MSVSPLPWCFFPSARIIRDAEDRPIGMMESTDDAAFIVALTSEKHVSLSVREGVKSPQEWARQGEAWLEGLQRERDEARAEVERLTAELEKFRGPVCPSAECPDYDGEHPYHQNVAVKAHEECQRRLRPEIERLRAALAESEQDAAELRTELLDEDLRQKASAKMTLAFQERLTESERVRGLLRRAFETVYPSSPDYKSPKLLKAEALAADDALRKEGG